MDFSDRQQEPGKKFTGIGLVIAFHAVLVYALMNGLGHKIVSIIEKPMETKIVEEAPPPPPPPETPPPPPPKLAAPPPPFIPPPEVAVAPQQQQNTISQTTSQRPETNQLPKPQPPAPPAPEAPPKPAAPVTIPGVIDFNAAGCKPEYPRASLRNEETGTVALSVLIGADGAVSEVKIDKSSGFRNLDNAVKNLLLSGTCKNKPGTVDGKPQATWTRVQYVWKLE